MDGLSFPRRMGLLAAVVLSLISSPAWAATINVPADQTTIQAAIDAASDGDVVLVAPGTYYEQLDFKGKAITVKSSGGAAVTILDGNNSGPIVWFHNGEGNASVLQGFTFTHASSTGGSAVELTYASPIIEDDSFVDNYTANVPAIGSAITGYFSSAAIIRNNFAGNTGLNTNPDFYSTVVTLSGASPVVADNVFVNNSSVACFVEATSGAPQIYNNTMVGNIIGLQVPILTPTLPTTDTVASNNLVAFNQVGIITFTGNDGLLPTLSNNLVYDNSTANYQQVADQTGTNGNISVDPLLKDWADGDVHLLYGSPAIDAGDSNVIQASSIDFYGNARVAIGNPSGSSVVDIGASEYFPPTVTAVGGAFQLLPGFAKTGVLGESGADSTEPLTFAITSQPAHGALTLTNATTGAFKYVSTPGYLGSDNFAFEVTDPYGSISSPATEQVTVVDIAPTTSGGNASTKPNTAVTGTASATVGYDGQVLTYSVVMPPSHGTVTIGSNGQFRYIPVTGFAGGDSFTFKVTDGAGTNSNVSTESVTVTEQAPVALASSFRLIHNSTYAGTLSATRAYNGQQLTYAVVKRPLHGTLTLNAATGKFSYAAKRLFRGADSFTFKVTDQFGTPSKVATVTIVVY